MKRAIATIACLCALVTSCTGGSSPTQTSEKPSTPPSNDGTPPGNIEERVIQPTIEQYEAAKTAGDLPKMCATAKALSAAYQLVSNQTKSEEWTATAAEDCSAINLPTN